MEGCVLCRRKVENCETGALLSKDDVIAHQKCLLYASNIFCQASPLSDDLFGFSVEDVQEEAKRGAKLKCKKCKKNGATVGCEVKRCHKSYHFPCAMEAGATKMHDADKGSYGILCKHHSERKSLNGQSSAASSSHSSTNQRKTGTPRVGLQRRLNFNDEQEEGSSKAKRKRILEHVSSDEETDSDISMFAPLESDLDESPIPPLDQERNNSVSESSAQLPLKELEEIGHQSMDKSEDKINEEETTDLNSDAESESLIRPVNICLDSQLFLEVETQTSPLTPTDLVKSEPASLENGFNDFRPKHGSSPSFTEPSFLQTSSSSSFSSSSSSSFSKLNQSNPAIVGNVSVSSGPPETIQTSKPTMDSASFWKSCNVAGCTHAIFSDFFSGIKAAAERIEEDQASQEDYDLALSVVTASGKLLEFVSKQQQALQRKLTDLQKAASAMKDAVILLQGQE